MRTFMSFCLVVLGLALPARAAQPVPPFPAPPSPARPRQSGYVHANGVNPWTDLFNAAVLEFLRKP